MAENNYSIDVKFSEANEKAKEMAEEVLAMQNILTELDEAISTMTWNGAKAQEFKNKIREAKEELDDTYKNYVTKIPEQIENSLKNYKIKEES